MFATPAIAQPTSDGFGGLLGSPVMLLVVMFAIMYFLVIRPQQKRAKDHRLMVENLRRGDTVVTQGGLIGKVTKVREDNEIEVELAKDVQVRVVKSTVSQVLSKTEPVKSAS